jgi:hypothetical protein
MIRRAAEWGDAGNPSLSLTYDLAPDRAGDPGGAATGESAGCSRRDGTQLRNDRGVDRRIGDHAEAVTEVLVHDLELSEVEIAEFVRFVLPKAA